VSNDYTNPWALITLTLTLTDPHYVYKDIFYAIRGLSHRQHAKS